MIQVPTGSKRLEHSMEFYERSLEEYNMDG